MTDRPGIGDDGANGSRGAAAKASQPSIRQDFSHYVLGSDQFIATTAVPIMGNLTYSYDVLAAADEHGNLSYSDACRLLADHGVTWADLYEDPFALSQWPKVQAKHAETLLAVLGY